jgi:serine/threonine-protein kinase HipA
VELTGKMSKHNTLAIWTNGRKVGVWARTATGPTSLQYDDRWVASSEGRVLSLSLPFTPENHPHRTKAVTNFFDNLLPDNDEIRKRIKARHSTETTGTFDLLSAIGRECVGAVQLLPEGEKPQGYDSITAKKLGDTEVESVITSAISGDRPAGKSPHVDFRISIAGAQEKTALLFHRNSWWIPQGATPTTHIFKLPLGLVGNLQIDMKDSVENEWLCSCLMRAFGLATASCEIAYFGTKKVLVVERFDRVWQQGKQWIARLPQEDFCQALGKSGANKYENEGGPGMLDIVRVLNGSANAMADKYAFIKAQIIFFLLAATDGHAKNFSIFHDRGGGYRLTPFYDVLSAWPIIGRGNGKLDIHRAALAMAVRGNSPHRKLLEIKPYHWVSLARVAGLPQGEALLEEVCSQLPNVLETVSQLLPKGFPSSVADPIFRGMVRQAKTLKL